MNGGGGMLPMISLCSNPSCAAPLYNYNSTGGGAAVTCKDCQTGSYCTTKCREDHRPDHIGIASNMAHDVPAGQQGQPAGLVGLGQGPVLPVRAAPALVGAGGPNGGSNGSKGNARGVQGQKFQIRPLSECQRNQREKILAQIFDRHLPSTSEGGPPPYAPPIDAVCTLCGQGPSYSYSSSSNDQYSHHRDRLVASGCAPCFSGRGPGGKTREKAAYVHPVCLGRHARNRLVEEWRKMAAQAEAEAEEVQVDNSQEEENQEEEEEKSNKRTDAGEDSPADANSGLDRIPTMDEVVLRCYSVCPNAPRCGGAILRGSVACALYDLAVADCDSQQLCSQGDVLWCAVRVQLASELVRQAQHCQQRQGRRRWAGVASGVILVRVQALTDEVLTVLGPESDQTGLDQYRILALWMRHTVQRFLDPDDVSVEAVETTLDQCMDVVATCDSTACPRLRSVAADYRDLVAEALTRLHREARGYDGGDDDAAGEVGADGKPLDVHVPNHFDDDYHDGRQSQVSDISGQYHEDHHHHQTAGIITTVHDELYADNDSGNASGSGPDATEDTQMGKIHIAMEDAGSESGIGQHIREYQEARVREPRESEAYMSHTLSIAELLANDGRYVEALAELDELRDLAARVLGTGHGMSRQILNHRDKLQGALHTDWVPALPSMEVLAARTRAAQNEYGLDSIESFRMQIFLIAKHVQSGQVDLAVRIICALRHRSLHALAEDHEFNRGNDGVLANIRDHLAWGSHPWLNVTTNAFTGVTIAGSGRSALVVKGSVQFEWAETEKTMVVAVPIWGGTEQGLTVTFEDQGVRYGGSEDGYIDLVGRIDAEASSWHMDWNVQINSIPASSSFVLTMIKETPGQIWNLPYRAGVPRSLLRSLLNEDNYNKQEEEDDNEDDENDELAAFT